MEKEAKKHEDEEEAKGEGAEGEGAEGEGEGLHPPKKKLSPKLLLIIAVAGTVLLCGGIGAGLYFTGVIGGKTAHGEAEGEKGEKAAAGHGEKAAEGEKSEKGEKGAPAFFSLGDILVNLSGDGKRPNFLKIKVSLELADAKDAPALEALKPRIIDNFQVYLRELRIEDLRGSAGLYRLREELLLRVTEAVQPVRVRDVLFQEMLVQ